MNTIFSTEPPATSSTTLMPSDFLPVADEARPEADDSLPALQDAADLLALPVNKPPELVAGLVHQGSKLIIGGGSKSCKTWVMMDLALSIASGQPFWGLDTAQGPIVYLNLELPEWSFQERLAWLCTARRIKLEHGQFIIWPLRGHSCDWSHMESGIINRLKDRQLKAVFLDPTYKVLGSRDENSAGDMANLCAGFERLALATSAAVVNASHYSKGNQSAKIPMDRISGSGAVGRDADSVLCMTAHEEENHFVVETVLRNLKPMAPFTIAWEPPLMNRSELDATRLKQHNGRTPRFSVAQLMEALSSEQLSFSDWFTRCESRFSMSLSTFKNLIAKAKAMDMVLLQKSNDKYVKITKQGQ
jgi:hypothetical protein